MVLTEKDLEVMNRLVKKVKKQTYGINEAHIWATLGGIFTGKLEGEVSTAAKLYRKKMKK